MRPEGTTDMRIIHPHCCIEQPRHISTVFSLLDAISLARRLCSASPVRASLCVCFSCSVFSGLFVTKLGSCPPLVKKMVKSMFQQCGGKRHSPELISVVWTNSKSASQHWGIIFTTVVVLLRPALPVFNLFSYSWKETHIETPSSCTYSQSNLGPRTFLKRSELSHCNHLFRLVAKPTPF